jgi:hypothetical protein
LPGRNPHLVLVFVAAGFTPPAAENCIRQDFSRIVTASEVAVGRLGISLNLAQRVVPDSTIGFSLSFTRGPHTHLARWGALRWCENGPEGSLIGIEFLSLDPDTITVIPSGARNPSPIVTPMAILPMSPPQITAPSALTRITRWPTPPAAPPHNPAKPDLPRQ